MYVPKGQSSPGSLQSGQQFSKASRQIPQVSSLAIHFQVATPTQPKKMYKIVIQLLYQEFHECRGLQQGVVLTFDFNFHLNTSYITTKLSGQPSTTDFDVKNLRTKNKQLKKKEIT